MAQLIAPSDLVLYEGYESEIDRLLLKKPLDYLDELDAEFRPKATATAPEMFSTKLRHGLAFRASEVTVWTGYNGHRKSLFTGQVALDLVTQKRRTMLASFEMKPARTLARMARQAYGRQDVTRDELRAFAEWTNGLLWIFDHMGRLSPPKALSMCRYFADEKMGHQVIIDSMMMVCASEESLDEQKQFMTSLVRLGKDTNLHVHLVAHCRKPQSGEEKPPTKYDLRGSAAISDQADNVVTIWANKAKKAKLESGGIEAINEPDAIVSVEKQRNGKFEGKCKLWFDEQSLRFRDSEATEQIAYAGVRA